MGKNTTNSTPHATRPIGGANQAGSSFIPMKSPLSLRDQLSLMKGRGLLVEDEASALSHLAESNYYRLRGYWLTLESGGAFIPGTTFDDIWEIYLLDAELRDWVWRALAPIEVKARTSFAYHMSMALGPLAHEDSINFSSSKSHARSMRSLKRERSRALDDGVPCVVHNMGKYGDLPIWAAVEIMSMGTVSQLYGNLADSAAYPNGTSVRAAVARDFGAKPFILRSWLRHLTYVRNICAHHSRLFNRVMTTRPTMISPDSAYKGDKQFPTLLVIRRIYESSWPQRWDDLGTELLAIVGRHPSVGLSPMGFPIDWKKPLGIR